MQAQYGIRSYEKESAKRMNAIMRDTDQEKMLLSGASGTLGKAVSKALIERQARLVKLVRHDPKAEDEMHWDPMASKISNLPRLEGLNGAFHFSGANVSSHRWTAKYKREMTESRVNTTRFLSETLARLKQPPPVLITASAVGFYGDRGDEILDESSPAGHGYFPDLCAAWEAAAKPAVDAGIRVVHLRFGVVLGPDGGALARLAPMFRLGIGGKLGSGRQWMSWVSEADVVAAVLFALDHDDLSGSFNTVAPNPVTNAEFTRDLAHAVHRPAVLPAPAFALKLVFGEMAQEALLASTRAIPTRLLQAGFRFTYPTLPDALAAAIKK
jgi:uncharacterized protein (TIGR01777 family)